MKYTLSRKDIPFQKNSISKFSWRDKLDIFSLEKHAKSCLQNKKWKQAEEIFSKLLDCDDVYWIFLGQALLGQRKYSSAKECFEKVLPQAQPQTPWTFEVFKFLGLCCCFMGDLDSAEENLNKALALKKNTFDPDLALGQGILLKNKGLYNEAKIKFQQILEKDIKNDSAWAELAETRVLLEDLELAYVNLQQALDLNPENETALKIKVRWADRFKESIGSRPVFSFRA